jgi:hypothetical protein
VNMDVEALVSHREALRLIEKDLQFATKNAAKVMTSAISMCCNLN